MQPGASVKVGDQFFYLLDVVETSASQVITNPTPTQLIGPIVLGDWLPPQVKVSYVNGQPGVGVQTVVSSVLPFNTQVWPPRIVGWEAFVTPGSHGRFAYLVDVVECPLPDGNGNHIIHNMASLQPAQWGRPHRHSGRAGGLPGVHTAQGDAQQDDAHSAPPDRATGRDRCAHRYGTDVHS